MEPLPLKSWFAEIKEFSPLALAGMALTLVLMWMGSRLDR